MAHLKIRKIKIVSAECYDAFGKRLRFSKLGLVLSCLSARNSAALIWLIFVKSSYLGRVLKFVDTFAFS